MQEKKRNSKIIVRGNSYSKNGKNIQKCEIKEERNSDFSGEKPNTKVQGRESEQCQKHYKLWKINDMAIRETLDMSEWKSNGGGSSFWFWNCVTKWLSRYQNFCGDCSFWSRGLVFLFFSNLETKGSSLANARDIRYNIISRASLRFITISKVHWLTWVKALRISLNVTCSSDYLLHNNRSDKTCSMVMIKGVASEKVIVYTCVVSWLVNTSL